ncbi:PHD finger protein [Chloropicon primus]|uniref:PHD-type domain-containing protein n=2 Tax=Chloropicon primus TaxID=1764295 RepID=A0A5B8MBY4_9CHLO|nr:hypothetical protein A3770_01p01690 [Chloropicon primus]UPQ96867.1 PHD finger protein [Chloropicon primus]|eukprot:QDZ17651.1 hypothetical protein A3770_01p01690 [Chloropicon primus]
MGGQKRPKPSPWLANSPPNGGYVGPFRTNVRTFLEDYGTLKSPLRSSKHRQNSLYSRMWTVPLSFSQGSSSKKNLLDLYVFEQCMVLDTGVVVCDNCRVAGWNSHPVCNLTYHFIVPARKLELNWRAGESVVKAALLENQAHLLHGTLHANGFGHLLRVNGYEGGSLLLSGRQMMEVWTNLCTLLKARVVTVEDVSHKCGLPYRLLHSIAHKTTWYGKWGYSFCRGPFNITESKWKSAVSRLHSFPLSTFKNEVRKHGLQFIVSLSSYEEGGKTKLKTLGDLMSVLLHRANTTLMSAKGKQATANKITHTAKPKFKQTLVSNMEAANIKIDDFQFPACRWSDNRLKLAAYVVLNTLSASSSWMSRQDVRDAARHYIGDTGLLDFVLKVMGNQVIGGNMIRREFNSNTRVLEYKVEILRGEKALPIVLPGMNGQATPKAKSDLNPQNDLKLLYNALVHQLDAKSARSSSVPSWQRDVRLLLDTKQFEKNYYCEVESKSREPPTVMKNAIRLLVSVKLEDGIATPRGKSQGHSRAHKVAIPCEVLVLPESSTVRQLKEEISRAMKDLYTIFENFKVTDILSGIRASQISDQARLRDLKIDRFIVAKGVGISKNTLYYHVGGVEDWIVDCICGTKDDDGERMVECERCSRWVHTRCYGYPDSAPCPENFICSKCRKHHRRG